MATGALDSNGIWQYGEDDSETTFSALLNKLGASTSTQVGKRKVLQVVHASYAVSTSNSTNTQVATGLTASITPSSTSSKILVLINQGDCQKSSGNSGNWLALYLYRNSTQLERQLACYTGFSSDNYVGTVTFNYLDSPATTSAVTYSTKFSNLANAAAVVVNGNSTPSHITLMEIAG